MVKCLIFGVLLLFLHSENKNLWVATNANALCFEDVVSFNDEISAANFFDWECAELFLDEVVEDYDSEVILFKLKRGVENNTCIHLKRVGISYNVPRLATISFFYTNLPPPQYSA